MYSFIMYHIGIALQSKQLRDPFKDWPELDIMEVEVTDSSQDSGELDDCEADG